jgi:hypothetical protein
MGYATRHLAYKNGHRAAGSASRIVPQGCLCGGSLILLVVSLSPAEAAIAAAAINVTGAPKITSAVRLDAYRCENECAGPYGELACTVAGRLVDGRNGVLACYGRTSARVWW